MKPTTREVYDGKKSPSIEKAASYLEIRLRRSQWYLLSKGEKHYKVPVKRLGNRPYAYHQGERLEAVVRALIVNPCCFITLTRRYDPSDSVSVEKSWSRFRKEVPKLIRKLKVKAYVYAYEAHESGGCHCHILAQGKVDIDTVRRYWKGHVKVKKADGKAKAYLSKELGKAGHVEGALKEWKEKGTLSAKNAKKVWRCYYLTKLRMRGWGASKGLTQGQKDVQSESLDDLFLDIIKSTAEDTVERRLISRFITSHRDFRPFTEPIQQPELKFLASIVNPCIIRLGEYPQTPP